MHSVFDDLNSFTTNRVSTSHWT